MTRRSFSVVLASALLVIAGRQALGGPETPAIAPRPLARLDAQGDPLPPAAVARLGSLRFYHGDSIDAVAFLRDGQTLLSMGDGVLRAWRTASGKETALPVSLPCPTNSFAVSPNGKLLAVAGRDHVARICDLQTDRILREWKLEENNNGVLSFSPDNQTVAWVDANNRIHLRDLATDRETRVFTGQDYPPYVVSFAPGGKKLASLSSNGEINYCDIATGKRTRRYSLLNERQSLTQFQYAPDGRSLLAVGSNGSIVAYDADSIEERFRIDPPTSQANAIAVSPDHETFATGGKDGSIRIWSIRTGKAVKVFPPGTDARYISAITFSADGKTIATAMGAKIHLWDVASGKELLAGTARDSFATAAFSPSGEEVITLQPDALTRWSIPTGKVARQFKLTGGPITGATLSANRQLLAVAREDTPVSILDVGRGVERARTTAMFRKEVSLVFTPDERYLAGIGSEDVNAIRFWSPLTGKDVLTLKGAGTQPLLYALATSRDGRTLFTVGQEDKALVRWELFSGQRRGCYRMPDPQPLQAQMGGCMVVWGGRGRQATASRLPLALSADSRLLGVCRGEYLFLCDLRTEKILHALVEDKPFTCVAFSPDGHWLAAGAEDRQVRLYDVRTGKLYSAVQGHRASISQVDFSANSERLLSNSADGTVLIWDVSEANRLAALAPKSETSRTLEALWIDLASEDAGIAEKAQLALEDQPARALPFLSRNIKPAETVEPSRLKKLLVDLDSNDQATRDQASAQLDQLGEQAAAALRKAGDSPSAEVRHRAQRLLEKLDRPTVTGIQARPIRAVELLERLGTSPARRILRDLAGGSPDARLTQEAQAALKRLDDERTKDKTDP